LKIDSLVVLCDGNKKVGLGHFYRCLHLSHSLFKHFSIPILWVGDIDNEQIRYLKYLGHQCNYSENLDCSVSRITSLSKRLVLVDSYFLTVAHLDVINKHHELCVIDDFGCLDLSSASTAINFTVDASKYNYKAQTKLLGPQYFLCDSRLDNVRDKNIKRHQKTEEKLRVLIAIGGHDRLTIGPDVASLFAKSNTTEVTLLGRYNLITNKPNIRSIEFTNSISSLYHHTDLVVSGGGLTKYESAYCAIPNIVLAQTSEQYKESLSFAKNGLCITVGASKVERLSTTKAAKAHPFNWSVKELFDKADKALKTRKTLVTASRHHFRNNSTFNSAKTIYIKHFLGVKEVE
tara:strand:+ start:1311 stop:2351 length:1041 start_codon:yes stop_codon:yes gene_type:complete